MTLIDTALIAVVDHKSTVRKLEARYERMWQKGCAAILTDCLQNMQALVMTKISPLIRYQTNNTGSSRLGAVVVLVLLKENTGSLGSVSTSAMLLRSSLSMAANSMNRIAAPLRLCVIRLRVSFVPDVHNAASCLT